MRRYPARFTRPPNYPAPGGTITLVGRDNRAVHATVVSMGHRFLRVRYPDGRERRIPWDVLDEPVRRWGQ